MVIERRPLAGREVDHERLWLSVALAGAALVVLWVAAGHEELPRLICPFRHLTGIPCFTCGGTRALLALTRGDVQAAFLWNPLVAVSAIAAPGVAALRGRGHCPSRPAPPRAPRRARPLPVPRRGVDGDRRQLGVPDPPGTLRLQPMSPLHGTSRPTSQVSRRRARLTPCDSRTPLSRRSSRFSRSLPLRFSRVLPVALALLIAAPAMASAATRIRIMPPDRATFAVGQRFDLRVEATADGGPAAAPPSRLDRDDQRRGHHVAQHPRRGRQRRRTRLGRRRRDRGIAGGDVEGDGGSGVHHEFPAA